MIGLQWPTFTGWRLRVVLRRPVVSGQWELRPQGSSAHRLHQGVHVVSPCQRIMRDFLDRYQFFFLVSICGIDLIFRVIDKIIYFLLGRVFVFVCFIFNMASVNNKKCNGNFIYIFIYANKKLK